jgi:hypothetical protein
VADLKQLTSSNTVMVLPAFETAPQRNETLAHELADSAAAMNKTELQRLVDRKLVYQFALYLFRQVSPATVHPQQQGPQQVQVQPAAGCVAAAGAVAASSRVRTSSSAH